MSTIRFFAAAAEAMGCEQATMNVTSVGELRTSLAATYGPAADAVVAKCSIMIAGVRVESNEHPIDENDTVDILPPFAGG